MKHRWTWVGIGLVIVIAVVVVLSRDNKHRNPASSNAGTGKAKLALVGVERAASEDIAQQIELTGSVEPERLAMLASPAEGPVQKVSVLEGDRVKSGQILLTIGRTGEVAATLSYAEEDSSKTADELHRVEHLVDIGALPGEELDRVTVNHKKAVAALRRAQERSSDFVIRAPWDGFVTHVLVRDGAYVAPRTDLIELYDPKALVVRFAVPEVWAADVRVGLGVDVRLDAYPDDTLHATISRVYPELDRKSRTRMVEATLSDAVRIVPGMFARIVLRRARVPNAITVRESAVLARENGRLITFVLEDGVVSSRPVTTGIEQGDRIQVVDGLQEGELVVVSGNEKLKDGQKVSVLPQQGPATQDGRSR